MAELGATADASTPYLRDLNASAGQLERFLDDLGPFAESSSVNVRTLAKTADTARPAIASAKPTVAELTKTTEKAPELANNLEIVLRDLDDRNRAVEKDKRSPGGKGYTGFEAFLSYVFDQMMAINIFDENGYILKVNLSASECSEYQNADSVKRKEKESPGFISRCLAGLGPNQPGVTTRRPDRHRRRRPRPRAAGADSKKGKKKQVQAGARTRTKSKNAPGQPDLKKALEKLLKERRRREHADRAGAVAAERQRPERPAARTSRRPTCRASRRRRLRRPVRRSQGPPRLPAEPMRGRAASSVFANPVLVGAVTVLVVIVAVFLSYNANNGLPFVPTTSLKVRFANGQNLVKGNEIRSGGFRVGVVEDMKPVQLSAGRVGAELKLKLDKTIGKIPEDSRWRIRPRSALGLKYLELDRGPLEDGVPGRRHRPARADRDQRRPRRGLQDVRRQDAAPPARRTCAASATRSPAAAPPSGARSRRRRACSATSSRSRATSPTRSTELPRFFKELGDAARIVAPISETNARLFTTMADTWEAVARDPEALQAVHLQAAADDGRGDRVVPGPAPVPARADHVLRGLLGRDRRAARRAARHQPGARDRHARSRRRCPSSTSSSRARSTRSSDLTSAPSTNAAIRALTATVTTLNPQLRFYGPFVTVCNAPNYFFTYLAEHFSEADSTGQSQRALLNFAGQQDDSLGSIGADEPANGNEVIEGNKQYLHGRPVRRRGHARRARRLRGRPARLPRAQRPLLRQAVQDRAGRAHARRPGPDLHRPRRACPKGQTFTAIPETGPYSEMPPSSSGER